jgi:phosphoadenosine phosphosulfate reductase
MHSCIHPNAAVTPGSEAGLLRIVTSALSRALDTASPAEIIAAAVHSVPRGRLAVVSSFGTESAVLLKHVADIDRALPVLFLDTGWLFPETLAYRDLLVERLGLTNVRTISPQPASLAAADPAADLWSRDADACCDLRKVVPLADELAAFDAWINGRKRYQGGRRSELAPVEIEGARLKFNPLARVTPAEVDAVFAQAALPRHPLEDRGFKSVGCMPCTAPSVPGDTVRGGRWRGRGKTECGIHARALPPTDVVAERA